MLETGIHLLTLCAGCDQPDYRSGQGYAPSCPGGRYVFGGERSCRVIARARCGGSSEKKLMGREAGSLVGLEHVIRPAILSRNAQIRVYRSLAVIDIGKGRLRRARPDAHVVSSSVHATHSTGVHVAIHQKPFMTMVQIEPGGEQSGRRLHDSA